MLTGAAIDFIDLSEIDDVARHVAHQATVPLALLSRGEGTAVA